MTGDDNERQQSAEARPLEYWHSTEPAPTPSVLLALALFGGMAVGGFFTFVAGVLCIGGVASAAPGPNRSVGRVLLGTIALGLIAAAVTCFSQAFRKRQRERNFAPLFWRRPGRFFVLGALIGCGLTALLAGVCFGIVAIGS
jgi:hypothetical protein